MLPAELMKNIRRLEIRTDRMVEEVMGGAYHSVFKGRGIEFDEVREYTPDDDVRDIDWNVTARTGTPFIKKYTEERELNLMLAVDVSASGDFGSGEKTKRECAAELAALLAFSAGGNGDKVGLLLFSDRCELYLPPKSGRRHALRLIRELLAFQPQSRGTNIKLAIDDIRRLMVKRGVVFLLSDFIRGGSFQTDLRMLNRRHDVIAVRILDRAEHQWPVAAGMEIVDAETGRAFGISAGAFRNFRVGAEMNFAEKRAMIAKAHVDLVEVECSADPLRPLIGFFDRRRQRRAGGRA